MPVDKMTINDMSGVDIIVEAIFADRLIFSWNVYRWGDCWQDACRWNDSRQYGCRWNDCWQDACRWNDCWQDPCRWNDCRQDVCIRNEMYKNVIALHDISVDEMPCKEI